MNAPEKKTRSWPGDLALLAGLGLLSYGCWLAWHPLGFIVAGVLVGAAAFLSGYQPKRGNR